MPHGPVNSYTYNHINGEAPPEQDGGWSEFLSDREQHMVGLSSPNLTIDDLDELSDADIEALEAVWNRFGNWDRWDLVNWTHNKANLPEWNDPNGSSRPISVEDIFRAYSVPLLQKCRLKPWKNKPPSHGSWQGCRKHQCIVEARS